MKRGRRRRWPWLLLIMIVAGGALGWWLNGRSSSSMERRSISSAGVKRNFAWFTPESIALEGGRHPLVIVLHSLGMEGEGIAFIGAWGAPAEQERFMLAFPDGFNDSWNAGVCCGASMRNGVADVTFINDLVAWARQQPNVDPNRISLAGFSNGGMLALAVACNPPDGLVSVATSGSLPTAGCTPELPPDVMLITSSSDPIVPPDGGFGTLARQDVSGPFPSLDDSVRLMSESRGCGKARPGEAPFPGTFTTRTCADDARLDTAYWPQLGHNYDGRVTELMVWWLGLGSPAGQN